VQRGDEGTDNAGRKGQDFFFLFVTQSNPKWRRLLQERTTGKDDSLMMPIDPGRDIRKSTDMVFALNCPYYLFILKPEVTVIRSHSNLRMIVP